MARRAATVGTETLSTILADRDSRRGAVRAGGLRLVESRSSLLNARPGCACGHRRSRRPLSSTWRSPAITSSQCSSVDGRQSSSPRRAIGCVGSEVTTCFRKRRENLRSIHLRRFLAAPAKNCCIEDSWIWQLTPIKYAGRGVAVVRAIWLGACRSGMARDRSDNAHWAQPRRRVRADE